VEAVMADPFQNVSAAGREFIETFARQLEVRAAEPDMVGIVDAYLDDLSWDDITLAVDVGCGTGPVARRMASRSSRAQIIGVEPSPELVEHARRLAEGIANLRFETGKGEALPFEDGAADAIIFHTVLCHVVNPVELLAEAMRVLRPGGRLVVCDADFSKASLAGFDNDPLQACADFFTASYVTDPHLVAKIRILVQDAGFQIQDFRIGSRTVTDGDGMLVWVRLASAMMVERAEIGQSLADALMGEYQRRKEISRLYGHLPFATLIAARQA
jgi:arsenite methyltransferase